MKRRTFRKTALPVAGLAGCATGGDAGEPDGGTVTPTRTPTARPVAFTRTLRLATPPDSPDGPLGLAVSITDPRLTPDGTARVALTLTNGADRPVSVAGFPHALLPEESTGVAFRRGDGPSVPACSGGADGLGVVPFGTPPVSVEPGGSVTEPFSLVDDPTADACFEPGRYAFAPEFVRVGPGGEATHTVAFRFAVELVA